MFGANFQRKYALTDQGVQNTKKGTFWTVIVNLVVMGGVSILYLVMCDRFVLYAVNDMDGLKKAAAGYLTIT